MKEIRDNRIDAFCEVVGFEFDADSQLYLPMGASFQPPPSLQFTTRAQPGPVHDLTLESLEAAMASIRPQYLLDDSRFRANLYASGVDEEEEVAQPELWSSSLVKMVEEIEEEMDGLREKNMCDDVQRWMDEMFEGGM